MHINRRFPSPRFLLMLEWFCKAKKSQKSLAFKVARARASMPEEARLLFTYANKDLAFRQAALAHWKERSLHVVRRLQDPALRTEWQMWRYLHSLSPSGSKAERLCEKHWRTHPEIQKLFDEQ